MRALQKTNQQAVTEVMKFSRFGALAEAFVMDALDKHADQVLASAPENQPAGWQGVAKEIKTKLDVHFGRHDEPKAA